MNATGFLMKYRNRHIMYELFQDEWRKGELHSMGWHKERKTPVCGSWHEKIPESATGFEPRIDAVLGRKNNGLPVYKMNG